LVLKVLLYALMLVW